MTIAQRYQRLRAEVPPHVTIVAVSKLQPQAALREAVEAGVTDCGENYVREAAQKLAGLRVKKHFIGRVQTNKAKLIAATFDLVQSVDRIEAGTALSKAAAALDKTLPVLLQINISPAERSGCPPDAALDLAAQLRGLSGLRLDGLMAIGPITRDPGELARAFEPRRPDVAQGRRPGALHRHVRRLEGCCGGRLDDDSHRRRHLRTKTRAPGVEEYVNIFVRNLMTSMFGKIGSFFSMSEEEDDLYEDEPAGPRTVVPLSNANRRGGTEVSVYAPRSFGDVTEIADALRNRQVVIVNLQNADRALLQRVVDFTSGVAYTIDGKIQKLAEAIYLVVPSGIVVNAQGLRDSMMSDGSLDFLSNRG